MADEAQLAPTVQNDLLTRICFALGGAGLISAVAIDLASVLARPVGFGFVGALELVQYCIVGIVSSAIVVATLTDAHASVHVLTERAGEGVRSALSHLSETLTALFFLAVLSGDAWIAIELWTRDERSDLLGLPIAPMRVLWCAGLAIVCVISFGFAVRLLARKYPHGS